MGRTVLDVLRRAWAPTALPDAARRIVALHGLDPSGGAVLAVGSGPRGRPVRLSGAVRTPPRV